MKLVTFEVNGEVRHGRLSDGVIEDLGAGDLLALVSGQAGDGEPVARHAEADVKVLAPLLSPPKVLCAAANYQEHITEGGGDEVDKTRIAPKIFIKPATAIAGPGDTFEIPEISAAADWEAELCVVIGREARGVSVDDALDHVFGYTTSNDISLRSLAMGHERDIVGNAAWFDWLEGKWADNSAPIGPYLVTADEVGDPQNLPITLSVNGTLHQDSTTANMIFTVAELVAFCSRLCTLVPGDVILTGTPSGVGQASGLFLSDGDEMVVEVGPCGRLVTPVRGNSSPAA